MLEFYLAGALATAIAIAWSKKMNADELALAVPESAIWSPRRRFALGSTALLILSSGWPIFWVLVLVVAVFRRKT